MITNNEAANLTNELSKLINSLKTHSEYNTKNNHSTSTNSDISNLITSEQVQENDSSEDDCTEWKDDENQGNNSTKVTFKLRVGHTDESKRLVSRFTEFRKKNYFLSNYDLLDWLLQVGEMTINQKTTAEKLQPKGLVSIDPDYTLIKTSGSNQILEQLWNKRLNQTDTAGTNTPVSSAVKRTQSNVSDENPTKLKSQSPLDLQSSCNQDGIICNETICFSASYQADGGRFTFVPFQSTMLKSCNQFPSLFVMKSSIDKKKNLPLTNSIQDEAHTRLVSTTSPYVPHIDEQIYERYATFLHKKAEQERILVEGNDKPIPKKKGRPPSKSYEKKLSLSNKTVKRTAKQISITTPILGNGNLLSSMVQSSGNESEAMEDSVFSRIIDDHNDILKKKQPSNKNESAAVVQKKSVYVVQNSQSSTSQKVLLEVHSDTDKGFSLPPILDLNVGQCSTSVDEPRVKIVKMR